MSSPLIKISDQSWQLVCLCCNCALEVKESLRVEVGPSFVEYNHRFTFPDCQTYNQIMLTRDMFDNAHVMVLHEESHPFGESQGGNTPSFESMNDWGGPTDSSPYGGSSQFGSSSPFGESSPFNSPSPFDM